MRISYGLSIPDVATQRYGQGAAVLDGATAFWRASDYTSGQTLTDGSGNGHDAQLGSTAGSDTNDPLFLPYDGTQYMYLPGAAGNYASTPSVSTSRLRFEDGFDLRFAVALTRWSGSGTQELGGIWGTSSGSRAYMFYLNNAGKLGVDLSATGNGTNATLLSGFAPAIDDGDLLLVQAVVTADNGMGNSEADFFHEAVKPS